MATSSGGGRRKAPAKGQTKRPSKGGATRSRAKSASSRKTTKSRKGRAGARTERRRRRPYLLATFALLSCAALWLVFVLVGEGESALRSLSKGADGAPVEVLAAPRVLAVSRALELGFLAEELGAAGYRRREQSAREPGDFVVAGERFEIYRRAFEGVHGPQGAAYVRGRAPGGRIRQLESADGTALAAFTLEALPLGAFQGAVQQDRRPLALDEFPETLVRAVLAAEDARFFEHGGVDPRGILRAAWADLRRGELAQGGSTITQQVIKNRVVGAERSLFRKLREAWLALYVERHVSKERLLEIYLNEIYLGQRGSVSVLGMPAAARHYFGRDVTSLRVEEMALLAGMIASPGRFDPWRNPERALARRAWVLGRMQTLGELDEIEAGAAGARPLALATPSSSFDPAGDILDAVRRELELRNWDPQPSAVPGRVFTSIEPALQRSARRALDRTLRELEARVPSRAPLEGAVVVLRPTTGEIAALVGGRRGARGAFHRALDARRQPGSAFKPFVAVAAFEAGGWSPASGLADEPLQVGKWRPKNYDGRFRGAVTLRQSLEESLNVPMARLGVHVGAPAIADAARRAGVQSPMPESPSLALGSGELSPLELARAYATLAAGGRRRDAVLVRGARRLSAESDRLAPAPLDERTIDPAVAWLTLDALRGSARRGTAKGLSGVLGGVSVAAKTGTSQDGRDAWCVLVTGRAVVVVWVGRDDAKPARLGGARAALPVIRRMLASAPTSLLAELPEPPGGVVRVPYDRGRACQARRASEEAPLESFLVAERPELCERPSFIRRIFGRKDRE